jgi:hypothetical protein
MLAIGIIFAIFVLHVEPYFYAVAGTINLQGGQPGESPAVIQMLSIGSTCGDPPLFINLKMHVE